MSFDFASAFTALDKKIQEVSNQSSCDTFKIIETKNIAKASIKQHNHQLKGNFIFCIVLGLLI
jgi:hypothetical protein